MTFKLDIQKEGEIVRAVATGQRTRDNLAAIARQVIGACSQYRVSSALADIGGLEGQISVFDSFMIPSSVFSVLKRLGVLERVAIVDQPEREERLRFFESVAQKGGFNIRCFVDVQEALTWLEEDARSDS